VKLQTKPNFVLSSLSSSPLIACIGGVPEELDMRSGEAQNKQGSNGTVNKTDFTPPYEQQKHGNRPQTDPFQWFSPDIISFRSLP
jgi:hypothetical protein